MPSSPDIASSASLGYGSLFEIMSVDSPGDYVEIAEVNSIKPPSSEVDQVDVTHMQSPYRRREFIDGLIDPGECSFEMNYVPGSTADLTLLAIINTPAGQSRRRTCRITYPNGVKDVFQANLMKYEPDLPTDDKMTASVSWRVTGSVSRQ